MEFLFLWALLGGVGAALGSRKAASGSGFVLGFLLGPIGWIIILCSHGNLRSCPRCLEGVYPGALVCRHCGYDMIPTLEAETAARTAFAWRRRQRLRRTGIALGTVAIFLAGAYALLFVWHPASEQTLCTVADSQKAAVQRFPQLGVAGSAINSRFVSRHREWQSANDPRLSRPDWPEVLAAECARDGAAR